MLDYAYKSLDSEYNMLMSAMRVAVSKHLLDEHFTVIWANDYYYERTGYTKAEYEAAYHNHVSDYFQEEAEEYAKIAQKVLAAIEKKESRYECVCRMPQKGGTSIWIKAVGIFTQEIIDGKQVIYSTFTDISDLIRAQMEQSVTYNNLPGFVAKFRVGDTFHFVEANDRFMDFFGRRGPGDPPYSLVNLDNDRNRRVIAEHYPAMREGKPVRFVVQVKAQNGEDAWLQLNADCLDRINGQPVYLVIYIDITDLTEQREIRKKLEERSEMLRSALEMAERANRSKSDFLSRMSHDIRTPMNAIMGMIAIAKESRGDPARVNDCLNKAETSAKFLLSLINDILDMSKIESGKMVLKKKPFDFASFIRNITSMFYAQAEKKGISFRVSADGALQNAYVGDELKLNQILINLLGNAIKFTDADGTVEFSIHTGKKVGKSREIVFEIKDTGMGMASCFMKKLFLPFEQDSRQRKNRGGSGLGLAIASNYARMMNGAISVHSEMGKGSSFTVHVWLEAASSEVRPVDLKNRFREVRALIVDPNPKAADYAASLFKQFGASTRIALSSEEALALFTEAVKKDEGFTIILADWNLPSMDGLALARRIREHFGVDAPLLAVTAYDWSSIRIKAEAAGVTAFLQKPLFSSTIYDFLISATQDRPVDMTEGPEITFGGERVLLVEDNDINLEIAETLLESRNLRVENARDGKEAVECFQKAEPGRYLAILMDIQMPIMDGLEATRRIRALPKADALTVPIVAMSANAFDDDVEKSLEAGMNGHISKPIDIPALFRVLNDLRAKEKNATPQETDLP